MLYKEGFTFTLTVHFFEKISLLRIATILVKAFLSSGSFDVKALRAFRVLRPLRLVSGVPSKYKPFHSHE